MSAQVGRGEMKNNGQTDGAHILLFQSVIIRMLAHLNLLRSRNTTTLITALKLLLPQQTIMAQNSSPQHSRTPHSTDTDGFAMALELSERKRIYLGE